MLVIGPVVVATSDLPSVGAALPASSSASRLPLEARALLASFAQAGILRRSSFYNSGTSLPPHPSNEAINSSGGGGSFPAAVTLARLPRRPQHHRPESSGRDPHQPLDDDMHDLYQQIQEAEQLRPAQTGGKPTGTTADEKAGVVPQRPLLPPEDLLQTLSTSGLTEAFLFDSSYAGVETVEEASNTKSSSPPTTPNGQSKSNNATGKNDTFYAIPVYCRVFAENVDYGAFAQSLLNAMKNIISEIEEKEGEAMAVVGGVSGGASPNGGIGATKGGLEEDPLVTLLVTDHTFLEAFHQHLSTTTTTTNAQSSADETVPRRRTPSREQQPSSRCMGDGDAEGAPTTDSCLNVMSRVLPVVWSNHRTIQQRMALTKVLRLASCLRWYHLILRHRTQAITAEGLSTVMKEQLKERACNMGDGDDRSSYFRFYKPTANDYKVLQNVTQRLERSAVWLLQQLENPSTSLAAAAHSPHRGDGSSSFSMSASIAQLKSAVIRLSGVDATTQTALYTVSAALSALVDVAWDALSLVGVRCNIAGIIRELRPCPKNASLTKSSSSETPSTGPFSFRGILLAHRPAYFVVPHLRAVRTVLHALLLLNPFQNALAVAVDELVVPALLFLPPASPAAFASSPTAAWSSFSQNGHTGGGRGMVDTTLRPDRALVQHYVSTVVRLLRAPETGLASFISAHEGFRAALADRLLRLLQEITGQQQQQETDKKDATVSDANISHARGTSPAPAPAVLPLLVLLSLCDPPAATQALEQLAAKDEDSLLGHVLVRLLLEGASSPLSYPVGAPISTQWCTADDVRYALSLALMTPAGPSKCLKEHHAALRQMLKSLFPTHHIANALSSASSSQNSSKKSSLRNHYNSASDSVVAEEEREVSAIDEKAMHTSANIILDGSTVAWRGLTVRCRQAEASLQAARCATQEQLHDAERSRYPTALSAAAARFVIQSHLTVLTDRLLDHEASKEGHSSDLAASSQVTVVIKKRSVCIPSPLETINSARSAGLFYPTGQSLKSRFIWEAAMLLESWGPLIVALRSDATVARDVIVFLTPLCEAVWEVLWQQPQDSFSKGVAVAATLKNVVLRILQHVIHGQRTAAADPQHAKAFVLILSALDAFPQQKKKQNSNKSNTKTAPTGTGSESRGVGRSLSSVFGPMVESKEEVSLRSLVDLVSRRAAHEQGPAFAALLEGVHMVVQKVAATALFSPTLNNSSSQWKEDEQPKTNALLVALKTGDVRIYVVALRLLTVLDLLQDPSVVDSASNAQILALWVPAAVTAFRCRVGSIFIKHAHETLTAPIMRHKAVGALLVPTLAAMFVPRLEALQKERRLRRATAAAAAASKEDATNKEELYAFAGISGLQHFATHVRPVLQALEKAPVVDLVHLIDTDTALQQALLANDSLFKSLFSNPTMDASASLSSPVRVLNGGGGAGQAAILAAATATEARAPPLPPSVTADAIRASAATSTGNSKRSAGGFQSVFHTLVSSWGKPRDSTSVANLSTPTTTPPPPLPPLPPQEPTTMTSLSPAAREATTTGTSKLAVVTSDRLDKIKAMTPISAGLLLVQSLYENASFLTRLQRSSASGVSTASAHSDRVRVIYTNALVFLLQCEDPRIVSRVCAALGLLVLEAHRGNRSEQYKLLQLMDDVIAASSVASTKVTLTEWWLNLKRRTLTEMVSKL